MAILGTRFDDFVVEEAVLGEVDLVTGPGGTPREVLEVATGADVILAGAAPRFDAETLAELGCGGIVRLGVGVETVDVDAARRLGIVVSYVPDYGTEAVALHAVTLLLAGIRRLPMADGRVRAGSWGFSELRPLRLPSALTVGIVGYGRIGRRVAAILEGIGFRRFLISDPWLSADDVARGRLCSLDELLSGSDVVTLHTPPVGAGYLLGGVELASMRDGSVLVNTARGGLIDTSALVGALAKGRPAMAALDVFEQEPPDVARLGHAGDRLILTPHMSWYTEETELELRRRGAAEARRILDGEEPLHPVAESTEATAR